MSQTILYIEDSPRNITLIQKFLKRYDVMVVEEYHASTGIRRAVIEQPDLILVDYFLPDRNGVEVIEELRATAETKHIPIVALTAMDSSQVERECLEAGADVFLRKPISRATLVNALSPHMSLSETHV